jgi:hypothetical protein
MYGPRLRSFATAHRHASVNDVPDPYGEGWPEDTLKWAGRW